MKKSSRKYFNATIATAVAASGAVVVAPNVTDASTSFSDVPSTHNFYDEVMNLAERGIIKGFEDGTFRPGENVTRGQAAKIIAGVLGLDTKNVKNPGFKDVPTSHQYYGAIAALANAGIISGYEDETYRPGERVQRNHMAKIIAGAFELKASSNAKIPFTDVRNDYKKYITALYENNVTTGKTATTFDGASNVTRGQLAAFVIRAENLKKSTSEAFTIDSITDTKVKTAQGEFSFVKELDSIFNSTNAVALKGAEINAIVVGGEIKSVSAVTLNADGTKNNNVIFDGGKGTINGNLTINADFVKVKNVTVNGNVTLTGQAEEAFSTDTLTINGELIINKRTSEVASVNGFFAEKADNRTIIDLKKSSIKSIITTRNNIVLSSDTKLTEVKVSEGVSKIELNANVEKLSVNVSAKLEIIGAGSINQLTVEKGTDLVLNVTGKIAELVVVDKNAKIKLETVTTITKLIIPKGVKVADVISNYNSVANKIENIVNEAGEEVEKTTVGSSKRSSRDNNSQQDKTPPTIVYEGAKELIVAYGAEFKEPQVNATDNASKVTLSKEIKNKNGEVVSSIDTTKPGKYTITYTAKDASNNITTLEIIVFVYEQDSELVTNDKLNLNAVDVALSTTGIVEVTTTDSGGLVIKAIAEGTVKLTVTDNNGNIATINVIVTAKDGGFNISTEITPFVPQGNTSDELQKLWSSSDSLNVDETKLIDFRVNYKGPKESHLVLLVKEGNSYSPYTVNGDKVYLKDNGNQGDADLLQGDGIYSARVDMTTSDSGIITLVAGIEENGEWKEVSLSTTIVVLEPLTDEEVAIVMNTTSNIQTEIQKLQTAGKDVTQIKEEIVQSLLASTADVTSAGASESGNLVWYALKSGALGAVTIPTDVDNNPDFVNAQASLQLFNVQLLASSQSAVTSTTSVGNQRVVIFSAHGQTAGEELANKIKEANVPFTIKHFKNEEANVGQFKNMFEYGTIVFDTLGAALFKGDFTAEFPYLSSLYSNEEEQVVILTGEKVTDTTLKAYNADLKTGRLVMVDGYYAITPAFIQHYGNQTEFSNSLVYANSPFSFNNNTLANQFIENNASAYVGFKGNVKENTMLNSFEALLEGTTLQEALGVEEKYIGDSSLSYSKTANLANGSLEEGEKSWISGGHFDAITQLGVNENQNWTTIKPTNGSTMGIISSGVDETALDGRQSWVYQTFAVPQDMNVLKFDYNVVSNEPFEFIDSQFDDTFKATIIEGSVKEPQGSGISENDYYPNDEEYFEGGSIYDAPWLESTVDGNEKIIAYESINSSDWGQDYTDERQRVDVVFPNGDSSTYMTGWKTVTFDISEYQGKTITLKLQTWDLGDTAYPTAVLFDRVHLAQSEEKELKIDGVKEAFIPLWGKREYQFNAFMYDQFNEKITGEITTRIDDRGYRQPVYEQQGTFSLKEAVEGITLDSKKGLLTVDSNTTADSVTLVVEGQKGKAEHTVKLTKSYEDYPGGTTPDVENVIVSLDSSQTELTLSFTSELFEALDLEFDLTSLNVATIASSSTDDKILITTGDSIEINPVTNEILLNFNEAISDVYDKITLEFDNTHLIIRREEDSWVIEIYN